MKRIKSDMISATKLIEELNKLKFFPMSDFDLYHKDLIQAIDKARKDVVHIETTEEWKRVRKELEDGEV